MFYTFACFYSKHSNKKADLEKQKKKQKVSNFQMSSFINVAEGKYHNDLDSNTKAFKFLFFLVVFYLIFQKCCIFTRHFSSDSHTLQFQVMQMQKTTFIYSLFRIKILDLFEKNPNKEEKGSVKNLYYLIIMINRNKQKFRRIIENG